MSAFQPETGRQRRTQRARATEQLFSARPKETVPFVPYADESPEKMQVVPYAPNGVETMIPQAPYAGGGPSVGYAPNDEDAGHSYAGYASNDSGADAYEGYAPNEAGEGNAFPQAGQPRERRDVSLPQEPDIHRRALVPEESGQPMASAQDSFSAEEPWNPYAKPAGQSELPEREESSGQFSPQAYYRRPAEGQASEQAQGDALEGVQFVPPPKFSIPKAEPLEAQWQEEQPSAFGHANIYQPKAANVMNTERREGLTLRHSAYQVEQEAEDIPAKGPKKHSRKRLIIVACAVLLLGAGLFLGREWIGQQITVIFGGGSQTAGGQAALTSEQTQARGYDPAPAARLNDMAAKGIAAISGTLELETYAVTASHVIGRVQTSGDTYDFYLFSAANGQLLGYYEGLPEDGLEPQPEESFYVRQAPYLISKEGKPVLSTAAYAQYVGEAAVLSAFENGWAIIGDAAGTQFNYINREGELFSTLWFARALPFYGDYTIAYVDTGNAATPETRYILYVLTAEGQMERWDAAADMQGVTGVASEMALMADGTLVSLSDTNRTVCAAEEVIAYADCDALVVRDKETGKFGLFVKGEQHYDFAYDSIAPVPCEIHWETVENGNFTLCVVSGAAYPQPLSHYFALRKGETEEMVALSTRSVYPVILHEGR